MSNSREPGSQPPSGQLLIYQDGGLNLQVRLDGQTVWLTQAAMAELYQTTRQNITLHLQSIYDEVELPEAATCKEYLQVRTEGNRQVQRSLKHYSLDAILAVGYRVRSPRGTLFRQWATARLTELLIKGFTLDDARIKAGRTIGADYFDELLARIRDIRASERLFYQKVTDIYATSIDYDPRAELTQLFFQTVQNKMHWAAHLHRWSVGSFVETGWRWSTDMIHSLSIALSRKSVDLDRAKMSADAIRLVTLHFDGEMELRNENAGETFKGRLFVADPGDVIYSKIDVRNGAIGIIPDELGRVCVSSEYPVYAVDPAVAEARYVKLLFRTDVFRRTINSMISGASGRKRVQPSDLESVDVPFPPLPVQRKLVAAWEAARKYAAETVAKIEKLERDIEARFLADLGLRAPKHATLPKAFAVPWSELERWSVMFNQLASVAIDIGRGKFPVVSLGEVAAVSYGIQKCPANRPGQHPRPYLRVANVQRGELDLREIKYIDVPDKELANLQLEAGDMLFVEGNGSKAELGRCALWHGEILDCVHQNHILKVRPDAARLLSDYAMTWFNTEAGKDHFFRSAKTSSGLGTINSSELRAAPIPVPSLPVQQQIVERVAKHRAEIAKLKADATAREETAKADVEAMILGIKPVE